jgi:hypothetical protein
MMCSNIDAGDIESSSNTIVMSGYNPCATIVNNSQPEIVTTIRQLQIEVEIISKAMEIFYQINSMKINDEFYKRAKSVKGSRKIRLIFYCVFMAYNELECPVDPAYVADIVKLPRKEMEQALGEYAPSGNTIIEPEKMIVFYIRRINAIVASLGVEYDEIVVDRDVRRIINVCRITPIGKEWVQNTAAKHVAIAALYFYMTDIKGFDMIFKNISIFEKACYLSWACIRRYHDQIAKYYNSDISDQEAVKPQMFFSYLA